ncbi:hypothetical protein H4CHR_02471 [Variovorax sp. PBS-H4]|nr:hypothetical protein H4CHR_02471 [Variovorax sp. PBS-H4]
MPEFTGVRRDGRMRSAMPKSGQALFSVNYFLTKCKPKNYILKYSM